MNQIFKLKLVALMATLSGTLGSCHAMQVDGSSTDTFGGGIVRPAEPAFDGAFGAHNSAKPLADYGSDDELPPIVSPGYASGTQSTQQQSFVLPPIVTPGSASGSATLPEIVQATAKQATPNMLSPIAPLKVPNGFGNYGTTSDHDPELLDSATQFAEVPIVQGSDYSMPAPIIQASEASTDRSNSSVQQAQWGSGVSAGGVRMYPSATSAGYSRSQELPPIVRGQVVAPSVNVPSIVEGSSIPLPPVISRDSQIVTPMNSMAAPQFPMNSVPMDSYPMDSYQMEGVPMESVQMNSAPMDMGQTYFSSPPVEAPVISSGCSSCNGGGCSSCGGSSQGGDLSGCNSCGPGGCFNDDMVSDRFGSCGSVYSARRYLIAEALYFNRDDGLIANSNFGALNSFDGNLGWRFTIGNRSDATSGRELSYFGTTEMEQSETRNSAAERINARFNGIDGFTSSDTSAFKEAFLQEESKNTEIHSLEYNKVRWGWDVVKSFIGLRYINVQDEYRMLSSSATFPGTATRRVHDGLYEMNTHNNLIGPHVGGELFYDVGYRLSWSLASKAGAYANFNKVDTRYRNDGTQFLDVEDNNGTLSTSLELNLIGHYQLSRQARFRFGYNALWLGDVASVSDNLSTVLSPTTGADTSDSDDMFFHGVSLGFEIFR